MTDEEYDFNMDINVKGTFIVSAEVAKVMIPNKKGRIINTSSIAAVREEAYRPAPEDRDALFLSRKHRRISVDAVQSLVKRACRQAGLKPASPHKLRHTSASLMLRQGVDIRTISEVLGHSSISATQIYTHLQPTQLIEACRANPVSQIEPPDCVEDRRK